MYIHNVRLKSQDDAIMVPFTEQDAEAAIDKLGRALLSVETLCNESPAVLSFRGSLSPFVFKVQLDKCFLLKMKRAEV